MEHKEVDNKTGTKPIGTPDAPPDELNHDNGTARGWHRGVSTMRILLKIALVCSLLFCSNSLYGYANFREVKGEKFLRAINSHPVILYARTKNTWGLEAYEDLVFDRNDQFHPYFVSGRYIFWWGSNVGPAMALYEPDVPGVKLLSVADGRSMVRVNIETKIGPPNEEFSKKTTDAIDAVTKRFTNEDDMPWVQSVWVQSRSGVPTIARYWALSCVTLDFIPVVIILEMLLGFLLTVAGYMPLLFLVLSPSWLALPIFWLWAVLSVLYVALPSRAWKWTGDALRRAWSAVWRRKSM